MKLPSQRHIPLCSGNVLPGFDRIPRSVGQLILTGKVNVGKQSRNGLLAVCYIAPQKQQHNRKNRYDPYYEKGCFFPCRLQLFISLHRFAPFVFFLIIA